MQFQKKLCTLALAVALLPGCGGSDSDDDNTTTNTDGGGGGPSETTTFNVNVDDGKQSSSGSSVAANRGLLDDLKSFFSSSAIAEPVPQLDKSQFDVVIINGDDNGTPSDSSDDKDLVLDPGEFTVNPLGNGEYQISVPGRPRVDCYIATDLDGNGQLDLRAPTVNENLNLDPVSEYITRQVEQNAANFGNFNVAEINAILTDVQRQVENNADLRDTIANASTYDDAATALDNAIGNVVDGEFETAAAPQVSDATLSGMEGDYLFLGRELSLEAERLDGQQDYQILETSIQSLQAPAALTRGSDSVAVAFTGTEDSVENNLDFDSSTAGFRGETGSEDLSSEGALEMVVTALGLRLDEATTTNTYPDGEKETRYARSVNLVDITGSMQGFVAASSVRYDNGIPLDSGTLLEKGYTQEWYILGQKRSSFDQAQLSGDWAYVAHSASLSHNQSGYGSISHTVEASPLSINSTGAVNATSTGSYFEYGYETPVDGSALEVSTDSSFDPKAQTEQDTQITFRQDGTFSAPTGTGETSQGIVFPGNNMLAEIASHQSVTSASEETGDGGASIMMALRRGNKTATQTKNMLAGKRYRLAGGLTYNDPGSAELETLTTGELAFDSSAANADISGLIHHYNLDLYPLGWSAGSDTFSDTGFSVSVTSEGLIQVEKTTTSSHGDEPTELNGFVSADGETLVLVLATREYGDNGEMRGSLGLIQGHCTNCN